jgi:hypothetical protein
MGEKGSGFLGKGPALLFGPQISAATITTTTPAPKVQVASTSAIGLGPGIQALPSTVSYTDPVAFDDRTSNPNNSLVAMEAYRSEVRAIMSKEWSDAQQVFSRVEDRSVIWDGIIDGLGTRLGQARRAAEVLDEGEQLGSSG